jgi:RNA polymerase sigma factor (sigma-70 family)
VEQDSSPSEDGRIRKVELSGHRDVKTDTSAVGASRRSMELAERVSILRPLPAELPAYGSAAFWRAIEESDAHKSFPLEVLVKCLRLAVTYGDTTARNRIVEVIIRRTQIENEYWAQNVLKYIRVSADERAMLIGDLYADLCECLIRALLDAKRLFWEENFQHCLHFERQHVYSAFMRREGRWNTGPHETTEVVENPEGAEARASTRPLAPTVPRRVPRRLLYSMDVPVQLANGETMELLIEDERAQEALQAVEHEDVPRLVLGLPQKLKSVVWLIFWEGRTEKDTAQVLGITDRTVRNRLREALKLLRDHLAFERESVYE